ncbi:MAG: polysaccharide biosynthesis/export family protein [Anaeromyxobacteraceae bacterium]
MTSTALPRRAALALAVAALFACGTTGKYIWVDQLSADRAEDGAYRVAPGDLIGIRVWGQDAMSAPRLRVREDGRVTMPFLQDVEAANLTPAELAKNLEGRFKTYVKEPIVTVTVEEARPVKVSVLGEVARPGAYDLERGAALLHALAAAGGRTQYAADDRIFVLRQDLSSKADPVRIRFRWGDLAAGKRPASTFRMRHGDVIVVE